MLENLFFSNSWEDTYSLRDYTSISPMNILYFFNDYEDMDDLLSKPLVKESMFTTWLLAKKPYIEGKNLTYLEFV